MYRSGESEYYINRSQCRLRDIRELVMDTGIGVDGYSFIGQGKIAEIVSGRADSRREIFEEAAGIVKYRSKKAEAEKKLLTADRNLDRVNDIIADLETRIGPLKAEAERAEEYPSAVQRIRGDGDRNHRQEYRGDRRGKRVAEESDRRYRASDCGSTAGKRGCFRTDRRSCGAGFRS